MSESAAASNTSLGQRFPRTPEEMAKLRQSGVAAAKRMLAFIDASPTPYHAASNVARQLEEDGFVMLDERDAWSLQPGDRRYIIRDAGTLVAFVVGKCAPAKSGFRIIGAHTDSPNLRVKPKPETSKHGYLQLGVEIYGGVLLATWADRDLSLAGRVAVRGDDGIKSVLVDLRDPMARVSNVAIHLNRKVNSDGLTLNKQRHMVPMVGLGKTPLDLKKELAARVDVHPDKLLGYDLCFYDTQRGAIGGMNDEFVFSPRLDNLASSYAATGALCGLPDTLEPTAVMVLYDHEECGSRSAVGAAGSVLRDVLGRIAVAYPEGQVQAIPRAVAASMLVSADMAHAIHPNYSDKHDREHAPALNCGVVIKTNANQSYATSGRTSAYFKSLCHDAGFEPQQFVTRSDMACGSTIGPITAAQLGIQTVDVGAPMLSMHSCREMAGTLDVHLSILAYQQLYR